MYSISLIQINTALNFTFKVLSSYLNLLAKNYSYIICGHVYVYPRTEVHMPF